MSYRYLNKNNSKGFTLIELSIVLVIMGLMLTVAAALMISLTQTSRIAKERKQLETIENALIAYALTRGSLPVALDGSTQGYLDHVEIGLSTAYQDSWMQPYQYAVSGRLTNTSAQNFCVVLYQLQNLEDWGVSSCDDVVCVTNTDDTLDNGQIAAPDRGYHIAAYIFSTGEDRRPGGIVLSGKNRDLNFEYEMASNPYDAEERDDLVQELTFAELSAKICHARNTRIEVTINGSVWHGVDCDPLDNILVTIGEELKLFSDTDCNNLVLDTKFEYLARCDAYIFPRPWWCYTDNDGNNRFDAKVTLTP